jgi:hypothetical protein
MAVKEANRLRIDYRSPAQRLDSEDVVTIGISRWPLGIFQKQIPRDARLRGEIQ